MTNEFKYKLALIRIKTYARPGQQLGRSEAIDVLTDIWNEAVQALGDEAKRTLPPVRAADFDHE